MNRTLALVFLAACSAAGSHAHAQAAMRDPWVPPQVRAQAQAESARTRSAQAVPMATQVEQRLRSRFEAADTAHAGRITAGQARAAGLGIVADNFAAIDVAYAGSVSFADFQRWLTLRRDASTK